MAEAAPEGPFCCFARAAGFDRGLDVGSQFFVDLVVEALASEGVAETRQERPSIRPSLRLGGLRRGRWSSAPLQL